MQALEAYYQLEQIIPVPRLNYATEQSQESGRENRILQSSLSPSGYNGEKGSRDLKQSGVSSAKIYSQFSSILKHCCFQLLLLAGKWLSDTI